MCGQAQAAKGQPRVMPISAPYTPPPLPGMLTRLEVEVRADVAGGDDDAGGALVAVEIGARACKAQQAQQGRQGQQ